MENNTAWIGIDLDGTLAHYDGWKGPEHIGEPIPRMVDKVKRIINDDHYRVKIFTARAYIPEQIPFVEEWCVKHLGVKLPVTNIKDFEMVSLWDDRCLQVETNTGRFITEAGYGE